MYADKLIYDTHFIEKNFQQLNRIDDILLNDFLEASSDCHHCGLVFFLCVNILNDASYLSFYMIHEIREEFRSFCLNLT